MSKENPLWGAPRIHGELLKLGFEIAESTVSKYMIRRRGPPSQTWRTFLRNHAEAIAAIDLCVVPTVRFECLFAFLVLGHGRRQLLWFAVTRHPTAEWLAQQIVEAFPWTAAPTYLVRDNDGAYGQAFTRRLRTMGIRDRPTSPRSPWQNAYVERLIGTTTIRTTIWDHRHHTNLVRIASSLCADMIFGRDNPPAINRLLRCSASQEARPRPLGITIRPPFAERAKAATRRSISSASRMLSCDKRCV